MSTAPSLASTASGCASASEERKESRQQLGGLAGDGAHILHALLLEPGRAWHISERAQRAQVSLSTVHQVCTFLETQLWIDKAGKTPRSVRVLREPSALLDA